MGERWGEEVGGVTGATEEGGVLSCDTEEGTGMRIGDGEGFLRVGEDGG